MVLQDRIFGYDRFKDCVISGGSHVPLCPAYAVTSQKGQDKKGQKWTKGTRISVQKKSQKLLMSKYW